MNYTFQSFNFRGREQARPFYDLIANIAAEEYAHIELVSYAINLLLTGSTTRGTDPTATPLEPGIDARNSYHFISSGHTAMPVVSMGNPWNGMYVLASVHLTRGLEKLTGADMSKLFHNPDISNKKFPEARALEEQGQHRIMYRWSPQDFSQLAQVWNAPHPEDGSELIVEDGIPAGATPPDLPA